MSKQEPPAETDASSIAAQGVRGIKYLFVLQLASRGFTFVLNTLVAAYVETAVYGVANIQVQLLLNLILFLSREAFRRACLRSSMANQQELAKSVNITWLAVPWGIFLSAVITYAFLAVSSVEELEVTGYSTTMWLIALSSAIEILSEPAYILAQNMMLYRVRVTVEASAVLIRCVAIFILVTRFQLGLLAFGLGQVIFALTLIVGYFGYFFVQLSGTKFNKSTSSKADTKSTAVLHSFNQLFPSAKFDSSLLAMVRTFLVQSLEKLVLQEGEKIVLRGVASLVNQGIFGVVNGLGSLVTRILFQPIEEGAYPMFNRLLHEGDISMQDDAKKKKDDDLDAKSEDMQRKVAQNLDEARTILIRLLRALILIGLILVAFGPNYSYVLLHLLYSAKYSATQAPVVLGLYCVYVLVMGVNGITEAFAHASADSAQLKMFNILMIFQSVIFIGAAIVLIKSFETAGLILANCISMALRIAVSLWWIRKYFSQKGSSLKRQFSIDFRDILPHKVVMAFLVLSFTLTRISMEYFCSNTTCADIYGFSLTANFMHIGVGGVCGLLLLGAIFIFERQLITTIIGRGRS